VRLFAFCRHGESSLNVERRVNGDPSVPVALTEQGIVEARLLGIQVAHLPLDLCVHTRFERSRQTAELAVEGRDVPLLQEPLLDDIYIGELEGQSLDDYRRWKEAHTRADRFPGGESLDEAAARYGAAYRKLLEGTASTVLVVCHEIPVRYALNAATGSSDLDGPVHDIPNATPFLFSEDELGRAADRLT
jgi:probable phosphoglycerate mutase